MKENVLNQSYFSSMSCERKFVALTNKEDFTLNWLKHSCSQDPIYPFGSLNTLYYDTSDLSLYREKVNGDYLKSKIRLRWYDDLKAKSKVDNVYLEFKLRFGLGRHKIRKKISSELNANGLPHMTQSAFYSLMEENSHAMMEKLPINVKPILNIKYDRDRFVCPFSGARVCLDRNIRSSWINKTILPYKTKVYSNYIVLEIKDAQMTEIPWLEEIFHSGFRSMSFSKYGNLLDQIIEGS